MLETYVSTFRNPLKPTGQYMDRKFNIHKFCVQHTQYTFVFCVDLRKKQQLFCYTALTDWYFNPDGACLLRITD
jgi:hypothetical protein